MKKKYWYFIILIIIVALAIFLVSHFHVFATATTINYSDFADTKVMPWLDKATLFLVTFIKQVGGLFQQIFTSDFLNIGLKFLKGIWDFILGIFKLFFDLLTKTFKK
jgi:hypothetical protein